MNNNVKIMMELQSISREQIVDLLKIENFSEEYYKLIYRSFSQSRLFYGDKAYIFAQIGINAEPCSIDCRFCSMASSTYSMDSRWKKSKDDILGEAVQIKESGLVSDLFLMTTADYSPETFLSIGKAVREIIGVGMKLVANVGDFGMEYARELVEVGFTGAYHIVRLNEGIDTKASVSQREETIQAIQSAGLELYYCIEPIGPEHSYEQIADEIIRAQALGVDVMAAMRRTAVPGAPLFERGEISIAELCKIAAVTALVVRPKVSMNVHEPSELSIICGINQLYAEMGANPRDTDSSTERSRGFSIDNIARMIEKYGLRIAMR